MMNLGQQFIVFVIVFTAVSAPIYIPLWYYDPPLNDFVWALIMSSPIPLSGFVMRKVKKRLEEKWSQ